MENYPNCLKCNSEYVYILENYYVCPECEYQWLILENKTDQIVKDINGFELNSGDDVIVIKDLKIKGTSSTIKRGTKVKNIRLVEDDGVGHDIECKFNGVGTIKLKSSLVKKG